MDLRGELSPSLEITLQGDAIEKTKVTSSIKNVQIEISKERQLTEIHEQTSTEFDTLSKKHLGSDTEGWTKHLKNLQKVQLKVQDWQNSRNSGEGKEARLAKALSKEQRESLQKIYKLHQALNSKKNNLNSQLEKIKTSAEGGAESMSQESQALSDSIQKALESIEWSKEKIKVRKGSEDTGSGQIDDWDNWEQNPYKNFFTEDDYKSALNGSGDGADSQKDSQVAIEVQVASKLLDLISPPDISNLSRELLDSLRKEESSENGGVQKNEETREDENIIVENGRGANEQGPREESSIEENKKTGNCNIVSSMEGIFDLQEPSKQDYYLISCANKGIEEEEDGSFGDRWGGAFPKTLFKFQQWSVAHKLEIKVKTEFLDNSENNDYPNSIEFLSEWFNGTQSSKIIGVWNYESELNDLGTENERMIVKLTSPKNEKNIYLLPNLDEGNK